MPSWLLCYISVRWPAIACGGWNWHALCKQVDIYLFGARYWFYISPSLRVTTLFVWVSDIMHRSLSIKERIARVWQFYYIVICTWMNASCYISESCLSSYDICRWRYAMVVLNAHVFCLCTLTLYMFCVRDSVTEYMVYALMLQPSRTKVRVCMICVWQGNAV